MLVMGIRLVAGFSVASDGAETYPKAEALREMPGSEPHPTRLAEADEGRLTRR